MDKTIPISAPNLNGNELKYVADAIKKGWVSTGGDYIIEFEKKFAAYAGAEGSAACQSGTAALHLSLIVCGIGEGDLVIAPSLTFIAPINAISYTGAEPIFMDCDDTLCLDMDKLETYLTEECVSVDGLLYDKTLNRPIKAVLPVHVFGNCADMEKLMPLAERYNLIVIEDATEAVGTFYASGKYAGKMLGTIGDMGTYSFNGNKIITTGGGGMIVSRDSAKLDRARHLSTQAKTDEIYFFHDEVGYNYRMTNLQAALGVAQLEQLEFFIEIKKNNYDCYIKHGIKLLGFSGFIRPNYWFYSYEAADRDGLIKHLSKHTIQARPIWRLNHLHDMYKDCAAYRIEKAYSFYDRIVNVPCSSNLSEDDLDFVARMINEYDC